MYHAGALVYLYAGRYYLTVDIGKEPFLSPGSEKVFSILGHVKSPDELFQKVREEADRRQIGQIINLPL